MRKGKKQAKNLAARVRGYQTVIAGDSSKTKEFTCPGSNKKS